jgi:hypothetical protein
MTTRIHFTKTFLTGTLKGLAVKTHLPFPDCTADKRLAEFEALAAKQTVRSDCITNSRHTISDVFATKE